MRQYLDLVGCHPNQFLYHGRALVSTFAGDQCTFGQKSLVDGWSVARAALESVCPVSKHDDYGVSKLTGAHECQIHLIPALFLDPARYPVLRCIDGIFHVFGAFISVCICLIASAIGSGTEVGLSTSPKTPEEKK